MGGDAEDVAEGTQEAGGLRGGGEEVLEIGGFDEVVELGGAAAGVVAGGDGEPGAASWQTGGEAEFCGFGGVLGVGRADSGCAGLGEGVGLPAGDEVFEAAGGAADIGPGQGEEGGGGLGAGRACFGWPGPGDERGFGVRPRRVSGDGGA